MKHIRVFLTDSEPSDETLRLFDEVRDDLFHTFCDDFRDIAKIDGSDFSDTQFRIQISATRYLGDVTTLIRKKLKRYQVAERAVIERL